MVACGRRFGKSDFALDEAITGEKGLLDGYPVGWFAPNARFFEQAWQSARSVLAPIIVGSSVQKKRITIATGAVLEFWDLEDEDSGRSRAYGKVIVDEAAVPQKLEAAWLGAIAPTLLDYAGNAWFLSSPKGMNYFKALHDLGNKRHPARRPDWMSWSFPSSANPHLRPAEIERIAAELPELARRQEIGGEFVDLSGASVHRDWVKVAERPSGQACTISMGVDLAISLRDSAAFTAIATIARFADGRIFVLDVRRFRKAFHAILQEIERAAEELQPQVIGIETNQFQAAVVQELVRTTKLPVRGVQVTADKLTRFQPMLARYEQGLVHHVPGLPREFEEELFAFPAGEFKDMVDALGLAYTCCPPVGGGSIATTARDPLGTPWRPLASLSDSFEPDEHDLERMNLFEER